MAGEGRIWHPGIVLLDEEFYEVSDLLDPHAKCRWVPPHARRRLV
jgi:hypothetical protein